MITEIVFGLVAPEVRSKPFGKGMFIGKTLAAAKYAGTLWARSGLSHERRRSI
jgi:hypothetical protein